MKSRFFWFGAILLAIIPVLAIDITLHNLQWKKDVREQIINVTQNVYPLDRQQKAVALDRVFEINKTILTLVSIKGLAILICLVLGIYFLRRYHQAVKSKLWLTTAGCVCLMICSVIGKLFLPDLRHLMIIH
jgi:ABC-type Fe3+ transport system permease subunit